MEQKLVDKLVKAMKLEKGQIVLLNLWGNDEDATYAALFAQAIAAEGAMPMTIYHTQEYYGALFEKMEEPVPEKWFAQLDAADIAVDLICHNPGMPPENLPREKYPIYGAFLQGIFQRAAAKKKFIQITLPTKENAEQANMEFEAYRERVLKAMDIDYKELQAACEEKISGFQGNIRTIRTKNNCVLTVDTTDREWLIDAGDGALPCGEIYIAPVEEKSNGTIFFETLSAGEKGIFHNVTVTIKDGIMQTSDCELFNEFLQELPEGGNVVAELGIGMNPNVECITGDSILDENVVGIFHIAIGMNHLFGGKNECPFHMDFVAVGEVE